MRCEVIRKFNAAAMTSIDKISHSSLFTSCSRPKTNGLIFFRQLSQPIVSCAMMDEMEFEATQ